MKRKFSFSLVPAISGKPEAKPEAKQTPEPTPLQSQPQQQSQSHRKHHSKDSFSHLSAHIDRQSLDAATERELRAACRLILQNFKPSDHGMEDTDPRLDFGAMTRRRGDQKTAVQGGAEVKVRMPTGAPVDLKTALEARRLRAEAEAKKNPQSTLPVRTKSTRQRFDDAFADERGRSAMKKYATAKPAPADVHRPGTQRNRTESGDADSLATPMTGSTDAYLNHASTAPSSAALTSGGTSNRHSHQLDNPAAIADAQAADWMRKELDKRRQQSDAPPLTAERPPSRARSIRDGIKEYIFPGSTTNSRAPSRALSRTQSRESLSLNDHQDGGRKRSGSLQGWRSWGLPLRVNSRSSSRPGTRGRGDEPEQSKKPEVNLNRELPPLPSLDSWKDQEKPQEKPLSSSHIASVMRAQDKQQDRIAATRSQQRGSGSDGLSMQYAQAYPQSPAHSHRSPMYNKQRNDSKKSSPRPDRGERGETDQAMTGWSSTGNLVPRNGHARHRSADTSSSAKLSMDQSNFSRKISMDTHDHPAYPNAAKLQKEQQKSRLKKVFSGWVLKKDKKDDWMHKIEREGVKEGVLTQEDTAHTPVVRY